MRMKCSQPDCERAANSTAMCPACYKAARRLYKTTSLNWGKLYRLGYVHRWVVDSFDASEAGELNRGENVKEDSVAGLARVRQAEDAEANAEAAKAIR